MKSIIIEDSELAMFTLESFIKKSEGLVLVEKFNDPLKAIEWLKNNKVDLVFLDLELPGIRGFEFLDMIDAGKMNVIITTAYSEHAVNSYNYKITDYLLKPFTFARFNEAIAKIISKTAAPKESKDKDTLFIRKGSSIIKVNIAEIVWLETDGDYVSIHTVNERFMVLSSLSALEERLDSDEFIRVHRSFIVRMDKIVSIQDSCIEVKGKLIPIGKTYKEVIQNRLNIL